MFVIAARHVTGPAAATLTQFFQLPAPDRLTQLIAIRREDFDAGEWVGSEGGTSPPGEGFAGEIVPMYTCSATDEAATFHLVSQYRHGVAHLVRGSTDVPPPAALPADEPSRELLQWISDVYSQTATLNIGPARLGQRLPSDTEIETKFTLAGCDPLPIALTISQVVGRTGDRPALCGGGLTHRIIRAQIYVPISPTGGGYASFAARPDGALWAKAKHAPQADATVRREHHHVASSVEAGLAWARSILGGELRPIGEMTRICWDLVTEPTPDGDMCTVTVDRATMNDSPIGLCQVEVEYASRYSRLPATETQARDHVRTVATAVHELLAHNGIEFRHDDLGKVTYFRSLWGSCNA